MPGPLRRVLRRTVDLSWPVVVQQLFNTLMRTTDVVVSGLFSPAAVAAVGLADLYARISGRLGRGFGSSAIALSSQDTGRGATETRDEAITQAVLVGFVLGVPFALFGYFYGETAIGLLGATPEVARLGGLYLTAIFAVAPARHVKIICTRSLQGTGNTRTPMYVNISASVLNILGSVTLGLGVGPAPEWGVLGIGVATALANVYGAVVFLGAIVGEHTDAGLARPENILITKQLLEVAAPRIGEGLLVAAAEFPFNALLLGFGTEVNAGYQVGRRLFQQLTAPIYRACYTVTSIFVGQHLGEGDPSGARYSARVVTGLGLAIMGTVGVGLFLLADPVAGLVVSDPTTAGYAANFARTYGAIASLYLLYFGFAGTLQGAGETRTPFVVRVTGTFGFTLGLSVLLGAVFGYGPPGVYVGIGAAHVWMALGTGYVFYRGDWAGHAASMIDERRELAETADN